MSLSSKNRFPNPSKTFQFNDFSSLIQSMQIIEALFPDQNNKKCPNEVWQDYNLLQDFVEDNQQQQNTIDYNQNACLLSKYKYFIRKICKDQAKLKCLKQFYNERQSIIDKNQTLIKIDQNISFYKGVNAQLKQKQAQLTRKILIQKLKLQSNDLARKQYKKKLKQIKQTFFHELKECNLMEQNITQQNNRQILQQIWNKMNTIAFQAYSLRCIMKSTQKIKKFPKTKISKQITNPPIQKIDKIIDQIKSILTKQTLEKKFSEDLRKVNSNKKVNHQLIENIWKQSQPTTNLLKKQQHAKLNAKRAYLSPQQTKKCNQILSINIDASNNPLNRNFGLNPMTCRTRKCYKNPSKSIKRRKSKLYQMLYTQRCKRSSANKQYQDEDQKSFILESAIEQKLTLQQKKQMQFRKISTQQMLNLVIKNDCHKQLLQLIKNQKNRYLKQFFDSKDSKEKLFYCSK